MNPPSHLSPQQLTALLKLAGIERLGQAVLIKPRNHVWQLIAANDVFFLKLYTKDMKTNVNTTDNWLRMRDTHQPALTFEEMMRELHALVLSGKVRGFGDIKSLVYLSMLWVKHKELQRSTEPPFFVMRLMNMVGKLVGYNI